MAILAGIDPEVTADLRTIEHPRGTLTAAGVWAERDRGESRVFRVVDGEGNHRGSLVLSVAALAGGQVLDINAVVIRPCRQRETWTRDIGRMAQATAAKMGLMGVRAISRRPLDRAWREIERIEMVYFLPAKG